MEDKKKQLVEVFEGIIDKDYVNNQMIPNNKDYISKIDKDKIKEQRMLNELKRHNITGV